MVFRVSALGSVGEGKSQCDAQEATDTDAGEMEITSDVSGRRLKTGSSFRCPVVVTTRQRS